MEFAVISLAAFIVSALTLYSGFGLGTLLLPVFALFFPVDVAVAATALVHAANSALKAIAVGKGADWGLVWAFGVPAILAAFAGAALLGFVSHVPPLTEYTVSGHRAVISPVKLSIAALILLFALFDLFPAFRGLRFDRRYVAVGGILSGFFGGFSGHQGALRSAFLVKTGLTTESFVGTNAVIAILIDGSRLLIYGLSFFYSSRLTDGLRMPWSHVIVAALFTFAGIFLGQRYLHKVTMSTVQTLTGMLLLLVGLGLGSGMI